MAELKPWESVEPSKYPDRIKVNVSQVREEERCNSFPHVLKQLPKQPTVQGLDSPHQTGDHLVYEMLIRGPHFLMTAHATSIAPNAPVRGVHRHIPAPTLFSIGGKGWEVNDDHRYEFETYDLLVVPPYTVHQHGGDKDLGCEIWVPEVRIGHLTGMNGREQHKLSEKPNFPEGTEPLYDEENRLKGYRIKKGVLGIEEDLDVILGAEPSRDAVFKARREAGGWTAPVENTYDRYMKLLADEADYCREVDHVAREHEEPWEMTRQGKLKWLVHPTTKTAANHMWIYLSEIDPGSRSGKHRHMAEEQILVLEGEGYDVHDGERWDWEQGDIICVPAMTEHQHFCTGNSRALLFNAVPSIYTFLGVGGWEQFENAPEYEGE